VDWNDLVRVGDGNLHVESVDVERLTPGEVREEIAKLDSLIEELEEGILGNIVKAAGRSIAKGVKGVAKKAVGAVTGTMVGRAYGKVKSGVKKAKAIGSKIKTAAKTGKAYGDEYSPMLKRLEAVEFKLNEYCQALEEEMAKESVDLDEVSFKVKDDVVYISKDEYIALPGEGKGKDEEGNPTLNVFMTDDEDEDPTPLPVKFVESARSDAMKAMRSDPQLGKRSDKEDDDSATDDDVKGASKNIIMQMRKVISLRGRFEVEFLDGKKIKIPEKIARSVQDKYDSFRKPRDKEKFQAKVAKSYKSMLSALKESFDGETNQSRILRLVDNKIKENRNG
jgi:hypothetical protein